MTRTPAGERANKRIFRAPGRVNIIGEHTDYNDGLVMPTNTALYTWVSISPRSDRLVSVVSNAFADERQFDLDTIAASEQPEWIDYVQGVCAEIEARDIRLAGADIAIKGNIPLGGGLSSSASLELAIATAMLAVVNVELPPVEIAKLCQRAEHRFAGVSCGIMDQYAIACCGEGRAIMLDCRSLKEDAVEIPKDVSLLVTDSGVKHQLAEGGYNQRANECRDALAVCQLQLPEILSLRDVTFGQLQRISKQMDQVSLQRSRHVVSENDRVRAAFDALRTQDADKLGQLVSESHVSLRDDFEVSCSEVDSLVAIANSCDGVLGSRMVGAGFGGCVLSVVATEHIEGASQTICRKYKALTGSTPWMHTVSPALPAGEYIAT